MAALTITASQVQPGTVGARFADKPAGANATAGQSVYFDAATKTWKLADSDSSDATAAARGIALHGSLLGQPLKIQTEGDITLGVGAAMTPGVTYCVGPTPGSIIAQSELVNPSRVTPLGVAKSASVLTLKITVSGVQVPA